MSCGPGIVGVPHFGCCGGGVGAVIILTMRVLGGYPYYFGGAPAGNPLPKIRYASARVRCDFPDTGAFWEMTGNFDRWTGGAVTGDTSNMTAAEKASIQEVIGVRSTAINRLTAPAQYRIGGTGPIRSGTRVATLEGEQPIQPYLNELYEALARLNTWSTHEQAEQFTGRDLPVTFPVARYNIRQAGTGLQYYNVMGYGVVGVLGHGPEVVNLPGAMSRIQYASQGNGIGEPVPNIIVLAGQNFSPVPSMSLEVAKVRTGVTVGDEWFTETARWDDFGFGDDFVLREISCTPAVLFPDGIVQPPPHEAVNPVFSPNAYERYSFPGHRWPPPDIIGDPRQTVHPSCRPDLRY